MPLTKNEFQEWLEHPATKKLKERIKLDIEYMKNLLVEVDEDGLKEIQGRCRAAQQILDMEYEDLYE